MFNIQRVTIHKYTMNPNHRYVMPTVSDVNGGGGGVEV